jgi:hypothetical protein
MRQVDVSSTDFIRGAAWTSDTPVDVVTVYEIITPYAKYLGIDSTTFTKVKGNVQYYWTSPDETYTGRAYIRMLYLYDYADKHDIEQQLQPALVTTRQVYLPRFGEKEWCSTNKVTKAFS